MSEGSLDVDPDIIRCLLCLLVKSSTQSPLKLPPRLKVLILQLQWTLHACAYLTKELTDLSSEWKLI